MAEIKEMHNVALGLVIFYALVGGALVIISALEPSATGAINFSFKDYIEAMAIAIGGLSVGRGILANAKATATAPSTAPSAPAAPAAPAPNGG
jgi:hypothetical protein